MNPQPTLGGTISDMLDRLEVRMGKLGMSTPADAAAILTDLDAVNEQIRQLEGKISRKTAEGQFESILAHLRTQSSLFIKSVGGIDALKRLRQKYQPPEENWWWYLDVLVEQTSKTRRRVILGAALTLIIALGMIILVYQLFLRPDPQVEAHYMHQSKARDYIQQGQFDQALAEIDQSLQSEPNDTPMLVLKGVIFERQGKQDQAQQLFTQAEQDASSKENFLLTRSEAYLLVNQPDLALIDAQTVLKTNSQSFEAYMVAGEAYEDMQEYSKALDEYGKAYDVADAQNHHGDAATARVRIARVLQEMVDTLATQQIVPTPTPTP